MDCKTAQGLISDAVDREPVDAAALAEAKTHCNGCADCSLFVRTLLVARNVPAPAPPEDLADRVMTRIRAEHSSAQAAQAAAIASAAAAEAAAIAAAGEGGASGLPEEPDASSQTGDARASTTPLGAFRTWARGLSRQEVAIWMSAAAVLVAVAGISTVSGIRILTSEPGASKNAAETAAPAADSMAAAPETTYGAAGAAQVAPVATAGSYITIRDVVYLLGGPSSVATSTLTPAGTVTSALGSGGAPSAHDAYTSDDPNVAYLVDNAQLLEFKRVTRTFSGSTYQLTSAPLSDYGQWPTLPSTIPAPANADGSPTFVSVPSVLSGTDIYRLATSGTDVGIAVGPGTDPSDPAAGNPNWTWWTRAP